MSVFKNIAIILNYNDAQVTLGLAQKLSQYDRLDHILIVDNASSDNSLEILNKVTNIKIEVITSEKNGGYAYGNNIGLRYARNRYSPEIFLIANPDIEIDEITLDHCLDYLSNADSSVACIAPTMKLKKGNMNTAWKLPDYMMMWMTAMIPVRPLLNSLVAYSVSSRKNEHTKVDVLAGSLFFARATALEAIDYFDERTFLFGEENILAYKLKRAGYQSILLNSLNYHHLHSFTINKNFAQIKDKFIIAYQSDLIYLKHYLRVSSLQLKLYHLQYHLGLALFLGMKRVQKFMINKEENRD